MSWAVEPGSRLAGGVAVVDAVFARHPGHCAAIRLGVLRVDDSNPLRIGWIEPIGHFGHYAGGGIQFPYPRPSPFEADTERYRLRRARAGGMETGSHHRRSD